MHVVDLYIGKDFFNAPWLFAEAYKYRRLRECFSVSKYWAEYDVFFRQKVSRAQLSNAKLLTYQLHSATRSLAPTTRYSSSQPVSLSHSSTQYISLNLKSSKLRD